jgi:hypothetical protein
MGAMPSMSSRPPVTVATFTTEPEAVMAMNYLESNGIRTVLAGSAPASARAGLASDVPLGHVVQVSPDDKDRALDLLQPIFRRQATRRSRPPVPTPRWMLHLVTVLGVIWLIIMAYVIAVKR